MERPQRSPIEIPELVRPYIEGKSFCEIGCAEGDLLELFAKYTTKAVGIEMREWLYPKLDILERKIDNIEILKMDILRTRLPKAAVYFIWCRPKIDRQLFHMVPVGSTIISYKTLENKQWLVDRYNEHTGDTKWIEFTSNEEIEPYEASNIITGKSTMITKDTPFVIGILFKTGTIY